MTHVQTQIKHDDKNHEQPCYLPCSEAVRAATFLVPEAVVSGREEGKTGAEADSSSWAAMAEQSCCPPRQALAFRAVSTGRLPARALHPSAGRLLPRPSGGRGGGGGE